MRLAPLLQRQGVAWQADTNPDAVALWRGKKRFIHDKETPSWPLARFQA